VGNRANADYLIAFSRPNAGVYLPQMHHLKPLRIFTAATQRDLWQGNRKISSKRHFANSATKDCSFDRSNLARLKRSVVIRTCRGGSVTALANFSYHWLEYLLEKVLDQQLGIHSGTG
jgi:hypothetical protein